jgi:putative multicomponent Na+:H+ antiporter subunit B
MMDSYIYVITALLPLAALMLVFQANPYHALVIRGILGAISALVYTILGAADVGLTDALVGTLLAVTLYAVAVRSSLVLRLGVLKDEVLPEIAVSGDTDDLHSSHFRPLLEDLRAIFGKRHMRVELVPYLEREDLHEALIAKEVHAICGRSQPVEKASDLYSYNTTTRLPHLYDILQTELASPTTLYTEVSLSDSKEKHS